MDDDEALYPVGFRFTAPLFGDCLIVERLADSLEALLSDTPPPFAYRVKDTDGKVRDMTHEFVRDYGWTVEESNRG